MNDLFGLVDSTHKKDLELSENVLTSMSESLNAT